MAYIAFRPSYVVTRRQRFMRRAGIAAVIIAGAFLLIALTQLALLLALSGPLPK